MGRGACRRRSSVACRRDIELPILRLLTSIFAIGGDSRRQPAADSKNNRKLTILGVKLRRYALYRYSFVKCMHMSATKTARLLLEQIGNLTRRGGAG